MAMNMGIPPGSRGGGSQKPIATRKEVHLLVLGFLALTVVGALFLKRMTGGGDPQPNLPAKPAEAAAMLAPDLTALTPLPAADAVQAALPELEALRKAGESPAILGGLDAISLSWAEALRARDAADKPVPQRVSSDELGRGSMPIGTPILIAGRLEDQRSAVGREDRYAWLSVLTGDRQYAVVLADADSAGLVIGNQVQAVALYAGKVVFPAQGGGAQSTPLLLARSVRPAGAGPDVAISNLPDSIREEIHRPYVPRDDLYTTVDDELPLLETRPYYYTLAQRKTDLSSPEVYDGAPSVNKIANDVHQRPADFRGKPFSVEGTVFHAWLDDDVAVDKPFGVDRVQRILMHRWDWGPITEAGKLQHKYVQHLYELAAITDQPLPARGTYIRASGRFVKWRAIPVEPDPEREMRLRSRRHSDKSYAMFLVTGPWVAVEPEKYDWTFLKWGLSIFGILFAVMMYLVVVRDRSASDRLREDVVRLRLARRKARGPGRGVEKPADAQTGDATDAGGAAGAGAPPETSPKPPEPPPA